MKKIVSKIPLALFILFFTQMTNANTDLEDNSWNFVPNASINFKSVDFKVADRNFDSRYTTLNLALTTLHKKFFATINFDQSIKDESKLSFANKDNTSAIYTASRTDSGLTFGHNVWKDLTVFGGYKFGKTDLNLFSDPDQENSNVTFER